MATAQTSATVTTIVRSSPGAVDGTGSAARFGTLLRLALAPSGDLIVGDGSSRPIRRVTPGAVVTTVVTSAQSVLQPRGLGVNPAGEIYFTDFVGGGVKKVNAQGGVEAVPTTPSVGTMGAVLTFGSDGSLFVADFQGLWLVTGSTATRYVGNATSTPGAPDVDGPFGTATIGSVTALTVDSNGNLYLAQANNVIRRVTPARVTTTLVTASAGLQNIGGLGADAAGNVYVADTGNNLIRRMAPDGTLTTVAGVAGAAGYADGPGASALFNGPRDVVVNGAGDVFVADGNNAVVRRISGGVVSTFAGLAALVTSGAQVDIALPRGLIVDPSANVTFTDAATHSLRTFFPSTNTAIVAGGVAGVSGSADGAAAPTARFRAVNDLAFDSSGRLLMLEANAVRRISSTGVVTTIVGNPNVPGTLDATGTAARLAQAQAMAFDASGNLYIGEVCDLRKVTPAGVVTTVAGNASSCGQVDGTGTAAHFPFINDIAVGPDGTIYVAQVDVVRAVSPAGVVTTLAGSFNSKGTTDGTGSAARFQSLRGIAVDSGGTIYVSDEYRIRSITAGGVVTSIAGTAGNQAWADGTGTSAAFQFPQKIAIDGSGNIVVGDQFGVRIVTPAGVVTTLAGGTSGTADGVGSGAAFIGVSGPAINASGTIAVFDVNDPNCRVRSIDPGTAAVTTIVSFLLSSSANDGAAWATARFNAPSGIVRAGDGTLFVADTGNHTIRKIASNNVTTFAGVAGSSGNADGTTAARFNAPQGVALDAAGNLYVADTGNHEVRKITPGGSVTTLSNQFSGPKGVAVDSAGVVYVADTGNHVIKAIATDGSVSVLAGTSGSPGSADGTGAAARFSSPSGIVLGAGAVLYVADTGNHLVRAVTTSGVVTTLGGVGGAPGWADGNGPASRFNAPEAVAVDASGALFVGDTGNGAIRLALLASSTLPSITLNPVAAAAGAHASVQFTCAAVAYPAPTYRWEIVNSNGTGTQFDASGNYVGVATDTLTINDLRSAMNGNRYRCRAANAAGSVTSTPATLTVFVLTMTPAKGLAFTGLGPAGGPSTSISPPQSVAVNWQGTGAPAWTVSADQTWVQITNPSGNGSGQFTVTATEPPTGQLNSSVLTLTSSGDPELTKTLLVTFNRRTTDAPPIGVFDTPLDNSTGLQGSIAVTGWALDDVQLDHVEIWRDPVAGETTPVFVESGPRNGKILIGPATFVYGARPDIDALYSFSYPNTTTAGWGYMLLTQGLWNQGNGTYTLYAFAIDKAGSIASLGSKMIGVDNANANRPFGAIDTPSQGGTASGILQNFGWALTPGASCSISNPNVQVSIDSGPFLQVVYGDERTDIEGAFAGFTNAAGAGGHFTLDTTSLTNGVHTIGWYVTDSCGRADGMGSRFFSVANGSSIATAPGQRTRTTSAPELKLRPTTDVGRNFSSGTDVGRNFSSGSADDIDTNGVRVVRVGQNDRIEVPLPGGAAYTPGPLPVGSTFDTATNTFMWQPGPGFLGAYDLQFTAGQRIEKLRVVVGPPIRIVIDSPHTGSELHGAGFTIAGWAADLASLDGAGIDSLQVWAYPAAGGRPIFVGHAATGGARPDVQNLYGASFTGAGFTLGGTLPPGTYDLVVFAHSAAATSVAGTQSVRVTVR